MDPILAAVLGVAMRFTHIASMTALLGGLFYIWQTGGTAAKAFRTVTLAAIAGLLGSGLYNFLTKPSYPPGYHMWFGIKFLLALHVFAAAWLVASKEADAAKQRRRITGVLYSGAAILIVSAWLRWISINKAL